MATMTGKTILQLELQPDAVNPEQTYLEIHVQGQASSVRIALKDLGVDGDDAMQVVQREHSEITTIDQFVEFITGPQGKSPFDIAVEEGFEGNVGQWLDSLKGADGKDGKDGEDGEGVYAMAVRLGYTGTEQEYEASLHGSDGEDGKDGADGKNNYELAQEHGFEGTYEEWAETQRGPEGKSNYQLAVDAGFEGDYAAWALTQVGPKGEDGKDGTNGTDGTSVVLGDFIGQLASEDDLSQFDPNEYAQNDYFWIGKHVWMNINHAWTDMGDFSGPPGKDGTGFQILGELPDVQSLPETADRNGDAWLIDDFMMVWNGTRWQRQGAEGLQGEQGIQGIQGPEGKSALDVIRESYPDVQNTDDMIELLTGPEGPQGLPAISFIADAVLATADDLPETYTSNHGFLVGPDGEGKYDFYVYIDNTWVNKGNSAGPEGPQGKQGIQGVQGIPGKSLAFKGPLTDVGDLPSADNAIADCYQIGGRFHVWNGTSWVAGTDLTGPQGIQGIQGPPGSTWTPKGELATIQDLPAVVVDYDAYTIGARMYVGYNNQWTDQGRWRGLDGIVGKDGITPILKGTFEDESELPTENQEAGWFYRIGGFDYMWDGTQFVKGTDLTGPPGIQGPMGVPFTPRGEVATVALLPSDAEERDAYIVQEDGNRYVRIDGQWVNDGHVVATDGIDGTDGTNGADGLFYNARGHVADATALPVSPDDRDAYTTDDDGHLHVFMADVADGTWVDLGLWRGQDGTDGSDGADGKSWNFVGQFTDETELNAYPDPQTNDYAAISADVYLYNGAAWVNLGPFATGIKGDDGDDAYEVAVEEGYTGTRTEWVASLKGDPGKDMYQTAVANGFEGSFTDFLESQRGPTGLSVYDQAIQEGTFVGTFEEFQDSLQGIQGIQGEEGPAGPLSPAINLIGDLASEEDLPVEGVAGTGYAIEDPSTPGVYNCWVWMSATSTWFNMGHVVGAQGPQGPQGKQGIQGIQGLRGEKGDTGTLWIVHENTDPTALDGRVGDYGYNMASQTVFYKTGQVNWTAIGTIGGGNLNAAAHDGKQKVLLDGQWVDLAVLEAPTDAGQYVRKNGQWVSTDYINFKAVDVTDNTIDFSVAGTFRITNDGNKTLTITGLPGSDKSACRVVKVRGKVGSFLWNMPSGAPALRWFTGTAPTFTKDITTIVLHWDGLEMVGSVPD